MSNNAIKICSTKNENSQINRSKRDCDVKIEEHFHSRWSPCFLTTSQNKIQYAAVVIMRAQCEHIHTQRSGAMDGRLIVACGCGWYRISIDAISGKWLLILWIRHTNTRTNARTPSQWTLSQREYNSIHWPFSLGHCLDALTRSKKANCLTTFVPLLVSPMIFKFYSLEWG